MFERRRWVRILMDTLGFNTNRCLIWCNGYEIEATIEDISRGGCRLRLNFQEMETLSRGFVVVFLDFDPEDLAKIIPLEVKGNIRWIDIKRKSVGIQFSSPIAPENLKKFFQKNK